jgi:outer membrane immunogenic protein
MIRAVLLAGVASLMVGSVAIAADLPSSKGPPVYAPPPPPMFSWTGIYIGGQVGYEWGHTSPAVDTAGGIPLTGFNDQGVVGGGHVGYNYELPGFGFGSGGFVIGVEGDVNGASYSGTEDVLGAGVLFLHSRTDLDASVRGRIGLAFDRVLIYGTGGAAFASIHNSIDVPGVFDEGHETGRVGWTAGGGIEYAIDNNWSVRAEYRYTDYGHYDVTYTPLGTPVPFRYHDTDNRVQAGFSYKFGDVPPPAPPVVAKY